MRKFTRFHRDSQSTWIGGSADFFRDRRAHNVGDILTVEISINDKAALSNNSNVERKSSADADLGLTYDIMGVVKADTNAEGDINSNTKSSGQGSTARSEKIELSVGGGCHGSASKWLSGDQGNPGNPREL